MMISEKLYTETFEYIGHPDRRVWVYVPQHEEGELLPVVYMTDGQNLFDEKTDPYGGWKVISAVKNEIKSGSKGAVIVGLDNGNEWRNNDLTPASIGELVTCETEFLSPMTDEMKSNLLKLNLEFANEFSGADGEKFDEFFIGTVVPFVEKNFPVSTQREATAFCGSSSGGLFSFFTALTHNEKFGFAGVFSPAFLLYKEQAVVDFAMSKISEPNLPYLYMYTGAGDMLEEIIGATTNTVYDMLENYGYPFDKLSIVYMPENMHNEIPWAEAFVDFLNSFLFL